MMSEIGLPQHAKKLMKQGYDDLQFLQMKANLDVLAATCRKLKIPPGHQDRILQHLRKLREMPAPLPITVVVPNAALAETGSDDPLGLEKVLPRVLLTPLFSRDDVPSNTVVTHNQLLASFGIIDRHDSLGPQTIIRRTLIEGFYVPPIVEDQVMTVVPVDEIDERRLEIEFACGD